MKLNALLIVTVGVLIAADVPKDGVGKTDLAKLEGTWTMVSGEDKGEQLPEDTVKNAKLVIKGDKHDVKVGDVVIVGTHELDSTKKPKHITAMDTKGPFEGKTARGIYKLAKGEFTVCFAPPDKERPKEFTTKSGTGVIMHVWKRSKQ